MSKLFKTHKILLTLCITSVLSLGACGGEGGASYDATEANKSLNEQLEAIRPKGDINLAEIKGDTDTEKLLYLLDVPTGTKSGILIFFNPQIESFEAVGNKEQAEVMRHNRALLSQAVDENMTDFVKRSAKVYDEVFTPQEIKELTELYSSPVLQKLTRSLVPLQQKAIPIAQKWSDEKVLPRFEQLVKEQGNHGH